MTVKLNSLARWATLPPQNAIVFEGSEVDETRHRILFNLEAVTAFFIGDAEGERFLCTIGPGQETVEFNVAGSFKVYAEDGSGVVQYQSADLEPTHVEVADPVIFTRIAQRRHRNPELEEMMYRMQLNMERRFAQQAEEIAAAYAQQQQEAERARATQTDDAGTPSGAGGDEVQPQGAAGEKSGEKPVPAAGSEQQSDAGGGNGGA